MGFRRLSLVLSLAIAGPLCRTAQGQPPAYDPVIMDPITRDTVHPPRMAEIAIESAGQRLNGILYTAAGVGPHPVVVLLHGNPGNERNLDLAQAVRRAGYTVLFFNYRGSWGSGGTFSRTHALDDVAAALRYVRAPETVARYRLDPARVALVGHSMGGWLALLSAARDSLVSCVAALDFANYGRRGRQLQTDRSADSAAVAATEKLVTPGAPYRAQSARALVDEIKANADAWDADRHTPALSARPVLLIGAEFRAEHASLVNALKAQGARRLTALEWQTDPSFSDKRIALARTIIGWLDTGCALPRARPPM